MHNAPTAPPRKPPSTSRHALSARTLKQNAKPGGVQPVTRPIPPPLLRACCMLNNAPVCLHVSPHIPSGEHKIRHATSPLFLAKNTYNNADAAYIPGRNARRSARRGVNAQSAKGQCPYLRKPPLRPHRSLPSAPTTDVVTNVTDGSTPWPLGADHDLHAQWLRAAPDLR